MKKFKIKKFMTSFLMLAVMVVSIIGVMPKTTAYADDTEELPDYDFRQNNLSNEEYFHLFKWDSSCAGADSVSFWNNEADTFCNARISTSPIQAKYTDYVYVGKRGGGSILDRTDKYTSYSGTFEARGVKYYYVWYEMTSNHGSHGYQAKKGICFGTKEKLYEKCETYIRDYILGNLPTTFTIIGDDGVDTDKIPDGSADKPYKTDKLGTLVDMEKHYKSYVEMGNSDTSSIVTERTHHWGWNKKTSTGLNLLDNDSFDSIETYCYIKFYDVYKKNWITGSKEELSTDKFKKLYFISKCDASKLELEVKQTDVLDDEMIKELKSIGDSLGAYDLTHEMVYSYDFYFQLVGCKNGKYYKGGYVHFKKDGSAEEILGGKFDVSTNTADEDENGDIKDNDDSETGTGVTGTGDNYDDAKNNADAVINKTDDNSSGLDVASIKSFMSEVGNVPKAIGKLFSFLPTWVTTFIGFGFVVLVALIIIKAIRG